MSYGKSISCVANASAYPFVAAMCTNTAAADSTALAKTLAQLIQFSHFHWGCKSAVFLFWAIYSFSSHSLLPSSIHSPRSFRSLSLFFFLRISFSLLPYHFALSMCYYFFSYNTSEKKYEWHTWCGIWSTFGSSIFLSPTQFHIFSFTFFLSLLLLLLLFASFSLHTFF